MEVVNTYPDVRYRSEVLCFAIQAHMSDLQVKVVDVEKFIFYLEAKQDSGELHCPVTALIIRDPNHENQLIILIKLIKGEQLIRYFITANVLKFHTPKFLTKWHMQTVQTQEQSNQGPHFLPFHQVI